VATYFVVKTKFNAEKQLGARSWYRSYMAHHLRPSVRKAEDICVDSA
jgi:hypothetical protein